MRRYVFCVLLTLFTLPQAWAHSPLQSTSPANGAVLAEAPQSISFTFKKPAKLASVKVIGAETSVRLETTATEIAIKTDLDAELGSGTYMIEWRAISEDGHPIKGDFSFTVQ